MTRVIERNIEEAFVAYASSKGCLPLKLRIDGSNGWPDRTVITPTGKALFIEFKRPGGGSLSASQRRWLTLLEMRGFATLVADDLRQATAFLDRHL